MAAKKLIRLLFICLLFIVIAYYFYPEKKLPAGIHVDALVVYKSKRELQVLSNGRIIKTYKISLGSYPVGDKEFEGDKKTPVGIYYINGKNPNSGYYKNLGISYPDKTDMEFSKNLGKPAGRDIKIHGLRNGLGFIGKFQHWHDWTAGCIALTNQEIDELYKSVRIGTRIEIKP